MEREASSQWGTGEIALGVILGAVVVIAAVVWLVGGVAGVLFGAGWPPVSASDLADIVGAVPNHFDDPRLAWPARARAGLPGPVGFGAAVGLVGVLVGVVVVVATRLVHRGPRDGRGARWARRGQLAPLRIATSTGRRLTLGRLGSGLVAAEERQSVIVVAPTQTGKTTGLAVPAILEWDGPVLATSVKTDLTLDTVARRRRLGEVKVFDPTAVTGLERASWTPLGDCRDWQAARETAGRLVSVAQPGKGVSDADFWASSAARYLAPLLYAAALSGRSIADVLMWVEINAVEEPRDVIGAVLATPADDSELRAASAAMSALEAVWEADERLRSSLAATATVALDAYGDPTVIDSSLTNELTPEWLLSGANTAYLCATAMAQERLRPLFVTLIDQVIGHVYEQAARLGRPINPPLLLVLDEAANIAPLPRLDQIAATGAGQGVQLVTVVQDLAQVEARWGRKADTILNNHRAKLFGAGISCEKTLNYVARVLGDEAVVQASTTRGERGRRSTTEATQYRPLAPADQTRQGRPAGALLLYGHLPPARIQLRPWYADRRLRALAKGPRT